MIGKISAWQRVLLCRVLRHTLLTPGRPRSPPPASQGRRLAADTVGLHPPSVSGGQPLPDQRTASGLGILILIVARQRAAAGAPSVWSTGPLGRGDALCDHTQQLLLEAPHLTLQRGRIETVEYPCRRPLPPASPTTP